MSQGQRRKLLLTVLGVLLIFVGWNWLTGPEEGVVSRSAVRRSARSGGGTGPLVREVVDLDSEALQRKPAVYKPGRDPFRFGPAPAPVRTTPPPRRPPPRRPPPQVERPEPQGPSPPRVDVTYLGSFGSEEVRIAVFTDGQEIYNATEGDIVKEKFRVAQIGYESADLKYVDFPDLPPRRLRVGG